MQRRKLGNLEVSAIGLGCMSMTPIYGKPDPDEAIATIHRALELGIDLIDTSDAYGAGKNEELVGRALKDRRGKAVLATKFGNVRLPDGKPGANGDPAYARACCEASLKRLGVETIDLFYVHRIDRNVPIEDTVGELALSPVGLSSITKLAPVGRVGQMMGIWFVATALGNLFAGLVAGSLETLAPFDLFRTVAMIVGAAGIVALLASPAVKKLTGGVS